MKIIVLYLFISSVSSTDTDVIVLSKIITAECGICLDKEKYLVGSVVLNRRDSNRFPNTILKVVSARRQFDGYRSVNYRDDNFKIAFDLLKNINRDYKVLYFFKPNAPNQKFVKSMLPKVIFKEKYHLFAK